MAVHWTFCLFVNDNFFIDLSVCFMWLCVYVFCFKTPATHRVKYIQLHWNVNTFCEISSNITLFFHVFIIFHMVIICIIIQTWFLWIHSICKVYHFVAVVWDITKFIVTMAYETHELVTFYMLTSNLAGLTKVGLIYIRNRRLTTSQRMCHDIGLRPDDQTDWGGEDLLLLLSSYWHFLYGCTKSTAWSAFVPQAVSYTHLTLPTKLSV